MYRLVYTFFLLLSDHEKEVYNKFEVIFGMILFLYGADTFRSRRRLHKMVEKFEKERDPQGLNVHFLDCSVLKGEELWQPLLSSPFLAEKKMVVLENLLASSKIQKEFLEKLEEKKIPESTVALLWEQGETFKTKDAKNLFERLLKEKYVEKFDVLQDVKLEAWISAEVAERGGKINREASTFIAANIGSNMWAVHTLLDVLIAYKRHHEIEKSDVSLFLEETADDNIFSLVDALLYKRAKEVYAMLQEQYRIGKEPGYIFAMIVRQMRILLEVRDCMEREKGINSTVLAKKLGIHPFVMKKSFVLAEKYTFEQIKKLYNELLSIDIRTKTGQADQKLLLDLFVGRVSQ